MLFKFIVYGVIYFFILGVGQSLLKQMMITYASNFFVSSILVTIDLVIIILICKLYEKYKSVKEDFSQNRLVVKNGNFYVEFEEKFIDNFEFFVAKGEDLYIKMVIISRN